MPTKRKVNERQKLKAPKYSRVQWVNGIIRLLAIIPLGLYLLIKARKMSGKPATKMMSSIFSEIAELKIVSSNAIR